MLGRRGRFFAASSLTQGWCIGSWTEIAELLPCVHFTSLGLRVLGCVGGGFPRDWYTTCLCNFSPRTSQKKQIPESFFPLTLRPPTMIKYHIQHFSDLL